MHLLRAAAQALLCIPRTSRVRCRAPIRVQVAQGMAGLEGAQPPIVHRDLKPSNVFVDGAGGARVADMNLSLRLHEDCLANLTGETGTYLYMSPEMMRHEVRPAPSAAACLFRSFPVFSGYASLHPEKTITGLASFHSPRAAPMCAAHSPCFCCENCIVAVLSS